MARDPAAYLIDALEACRAIEEVLSDVDLETYRSKRSIRSSVEREFILIGEALRRLESVSLNLFRESPTLGWPSIFAIYWRTTIVQWTMMLCLALRTQIF